MVVLFLGAFSLRVVAGFEGLESPLECGLTQMWDGRYYQQRAEEIAAGDWLGQEVFYLAPLYPYALGLLYAFAGTSGGTGALSAAMVFQSLLGAGSVLLVASLGRRFGGRAVGLIAGGSAAVYEPFIYQESLVMPTVVVLFTHLLALRVFLAAKDRRERRWWAASGFGLGLAALAHGSGLALAGLLTVTAAVWSDPSSRRRSLVFTGLLLIGLSLPVLSVTARNWVVGDDLVLVTSNAGKNFYIGHHPAADGTFSPHRFRIWGSGLGTYLEGVERGPDQPTPSEVSSWLSRRAWAFIVEDPARAARVTLRKLRLLFNWYETPINDNQYFARHYSSVLSLPLLGFGWVAPLGLAGLAVSWRRFRELGVLYVAVASQVILFTIMFVLGRYRTFLAALLMIAAGLFVVWAVRRLRELDWLTLGTGLVLLALAGLFVQQTIPGFEVERGFGQQHLAVARHYLDARKPSLAEKHARTALRSSFAPWQDLHIRKARVQYLRGQAAWSAGKLAKARRLFTKALRRARAEDKYRAGVLELTQEIRQARKRLSRASRMR
jgi:4-amino-4-deoxy-L-arabinose transferase-like glycosyltransferase